jgi:hypothetical protein
MNDTMSTLFIGLGHYSRTGKDTFANYLVAALRERAPHLRVLKRSFAWKLKQITYELYAWAGMQPPEHYETKEGEKDRDVVLPALGMTPVQVWVQFGTKAIREQVYAATWLDYLLKTKHDADVLIIPDCRFPNEADAIKAAGGVAIKIVRPDYGPRKTVADRALLGYDGWDYVLGDRGSMEALDEAAQPFAEWIMGNRPKPVQTPEAREKALAVEVIEPWEDDRL